MANKAEMKELIKLVRAQQKQVELLTAQIKDMEGKSKKNPVNLAQESDVEGEKARRRSPRIAKKNKDKKISYCEIEEVLLLLRCLFSLSLLLRCFFFIFALAFFFFTLSYAFVLQNCFVFCLAGWDSVKTRVIIRRSSPRQRKEAQKKKKIPQNAAAPQGLGCEFISAHRRRDGGGLVGRGGRKTTPRVCLLFCLFTCLFFACLLFCLLSLDLSFTNMFSCLFLQTFSPFVHPNNQESNW